VGKLTFNDLKHDAEKALAVLAQQPEVNPKEITILGNSEGTRITPRVAIDNDNTTTKVKNIVLIGAAAQNLNYSTSNLLAYRYSMLNRY
jgi:dienelactone hydrolase